MTTRWKSFEWLAPAVSIIAAAASLIAMTTFVSGSA